MRAIFAIIPVPFLATSALADNFFFNGGAHCTHKSGWQIHAVFGYDLLRVQPGLAPIEKAMIVSTFISEYGGNLMTTGIVLFADQLGDTVIAYENGSKLVFDLKNGSLNYQSLNKTTDRFKCTIISP